MADQNSQLPGTMIVDGQQDSWESAFGAYRQALVDLNSDGVPDVAVPVGNRERQAIARRAMAGREPVLSPQEKQAVLRRFAISEENNQAVERGVGDALLGQPVRAVNAMLKAYDDPSLATITNAGVQSALTIPTTKGITTAAKIGVTGLGAGAINDMLAADEANAQSKKAKPQSPATEVTLPGLSPEQTKEYNDLQGRMRRGDFGSPADRRAVETRARELRSLSDDFSKRRNESGQKEYDDAVTRAETAKNTILAERPKKFNETGIGKVYDELGIAAPGVMAAGAGMLTRGGLRSFGVEGKLPLIAGPMATGTVTGGLAANYPLGHELMFAPAANPERRAFEAYARELPPTHPRKAEFTDYARGLPEANPARKAAADEFYDGTKFLERTGLGVAEGALGGFAGSEALGVIGAGMRGVRDAGNAMLSIPAQMRRAGYSREIEDAGHRLNLVRAETGIGQAVMDGEAAMLAADARNQAIKSTPGPRIQFEPFNVPRPDGTTAPRGPRALPAPQQGAAVDNAGQALPGRQAAEPKPPLGPQRRTELQGRQRLADETSLDIQEGLLSGKAPQELMQQYGLSAEQIKGVARNTQKMIAENGGDASAALEAVRQYRKIRPYTYAAPPLAAGAALNPMIQAYYGD